MLDPRFPDRGLRVGERLTRASVTRRASSERQTRVPLRADLRAVACPMTPGVRGATFQARLRRQAGRVGCPLKNLVARAAGPGEPCFRSSKGLCSFLIGSALYRL